MKFLSSVKYALMAAMVVCWLAVPAVALADDADATDAPEGGVVPAQVQAQKAGEADLATVLFEDAAASEAAPSALAEETPLADLSDQSAAAVLDGAGSGNAHDALQDAPALDPNSNEVPDADTALPAQDAADEPAAASKTQESPAREKAVVAQDVVSSVVEAPETDDAAGTAEVAHEAGVAKPEQVAAAEPVPAVASASEYSVAQPVSDASQDRVVLAPDAQPSTGPTNVQPASPSAGDPATDASATATTIADGLYNIATAVDTSRFVEVAGGSQKNGGAVKLYSDNATPAQRWRFTANKDGLFTIVNVNSGKALDVPAQRAANGTKLQQYATNGTVAQLWKVEHDSSGFYIIRSAVNEKFVLDIPAQKATNGQNVQLYEANGTKAQLFQLTKLEQELADGFYVIKSAKSDKALDVAAGSLENGGNVQQYSANGTLAQTVKLTYNKDNGYYTMIDAGSGKAIDVAGGSTKSGANVQQYSPNGTLAQYWDIRTNDAGTLTIRSAKSGNALDVAGGPKKNTKSGANVQVYTPNGTAAQQWKTTKLSSWLPEGTYFIHTGNNHANVLQVAGGSVAGGANVQTGTKTGVNAQRFYVRNVGGGYYTIQNTLSGKYLTASAKSAANLSQGSTRTQFRPVLGANGISFQLKDNTSVVLDIAGGPSKNTKAGANVQVYASNNTLAQRFLLKATNLLADGAYTVASAANTSFVLDNPGQSKNNGTAVQVYKSNKTPAQSYRLKHMGNGAYQITNVASNKSLQAAGSQVTQQTSANRPAQKWEPTLNADGTISFVSIANTSNKLTLAGAAANGTKVNAAASGGSKAQNWVVSPTGNTTTYDTLSLTLSQMAGYQRGGDTSKLNPNTGSKYKFMDLRSYTGSTAEALDSYMAAQGVKAGNPLYKSGASFVEAAQKHGVNEVYLLAHAAIESGWGNAAYFGGLYNFYGIGAGAANAAAGAASLASSNNWTTPKNGIIGGGLWIANNYLYATPNPQYTLYGMRYDYLFTDRNKQASYHQYATSDTWADQIGSTMDAIFKKTGTADQANFIIPKYKGQ